MFTSDSAPGPPARAARSISSSRSSASACGCSTRSRMTASTSSFMYRSRSRLRRSARRQSRSPTYGGLRKVRRCECRSAPTIASTNGCGRSARKESNEYPKPVRPIVSRVSLVMSADMTKLTLETIGRTGFGYSFDSFRAERPHPFVDAMVGALRHSQRRTFLKPPYVGDLLWRRAEQRNLRRLRYMNRLVDEVIRTRAEHPHADADDLLELMLRAARAGGDGALDEVNIRYQVITFLVAGHETTSGALSFALYYLSRHPDVLARATAEVDRVWGADEVPAFEQVAKLRYVRRVLDESMRLWPTAPVYGRAARADTVLGGRYEMRAGEGVLVVVPAVHRDPAVWGPDALAFDPDRFASDQVKSRPAHIYKPFGTGERACIGRQFALHEAVLVLGTILRRYELTADP